ncbi:crotonase/enoyl-CoA hydratase family protein [Acidihalobacter ferrooxydans]|uniref:Enoyl-CoA hydratase n=1 Tax=Acidihalobacter ferrooxydans TaxID=1765967 RepID=A0A1P8UCY6_9GAMM|nr:crotonase/enoyl-CoA hydratase family protein [Acidihalobacter ferrooxydans]APZ41730.1 enoyl-CoA hydratase [Acidihalobacter ferrooxydans]
MDNIRRQSPFSNTSKNSVLSRYFDSRYGGVEWCYMHAEPRPCFTPDLLDELAGEFSALSSGALGEVSYLVLASSVPDVFNLGGDLNLFRQLIDAGDRAGLLRYATACIDMVYAPTTGFGRSVTGIALVQGDALGGGFEAALAGDVLIAERHARMGMPEILFNLFPGMGALTLLSRRIGLKAAERLILSGQVFSAEELHEMGVVDVLAETGEGEHAVYTFLEAEAHHANGVRALRQAKRLCSPVSYAELHGITEVWVDAALRLTTRDLRMMERLVKRQSKRASAVEMA